MEHLSNNGVETHFLKLVEKNESLVKRLDMLPVECVVRNIATGSLCRRLGVEEGIKFEDPLFEFFLKDDDLGDPLINDNHITAFGWGTEEEIATMKEITFRINHLLCKLFKEVGLILVDYKVEYGRSNGSLILGDEFTPDGCRIWDAETGESLDKDRFRKDLGDVVESYQIVAHKLGISL
jgi:Phosphoribosylaminoimidazolesuccinocarboxamide (SAICAR) synthase